MVHSVREQNGASKSVYRLRLNVGLVDNARWASFADPVDYARAYATAGRDLRALLEVIAEPGVYLRPETSVLVHYVVGTEPTFYIECDLHSSSPLLRAAERVREVAFHLARLTGQEAVAWTLTAIQSQSDTQENASVEGLDGPRADLWRPFNPAYFVTCETPVDPGPHWAHV